MDIHPVSESSGHIFYETSRKAMEELGININDEDNLAMLVWFDTIKDTDYFSQLMPWQIVNRVPNINVICRKASFVRCIQRINIFFRGKFSFLPRSFILPLHKIQFTKALQKVPNNKTYIVKSDGGALGQGIVIIHPGESYEPTSQLSIAQEYIESYLLNGYKFDLRVYVLVIPTKIPKIYVYRDGIARFCSSPASEDSPFSQLTNTAVNRKNPNANISSITQTIKSVFAQIQKTDPKFNLSKMWYDIDEAIGLTVLSSAGIVNAGVNSKILQTGLPYRSFQLLGFDVLIAQDFKPYILEVNYRPSLDHDSEIEMKLKIKMLKDLLSIAVLPFSEIETLVRSRNKATSSFQAPNPKLTSKSSFNKNPSTSSFLSSCSNVSVSSSYSESTTCTWSAVTFKKFLGKHQNLLDNAKAKRKEALLNSDFVKIYPTKDPERSKFWAEVLSASEELPTEIGNGYHLPRVVDSLQCVQPKNMKEEMDKKQQQQQRYQMQQKHKQMSVSFGPKKIGSNPCSIGLKIIDKNKKSFKEGCSHLPRLNKNQPYPS
ncbi:positive regulation of cilium movement [Tritrichomonas musculus]|uniref:Positive regulation of cilium movement n=1 Tax=Tritrichomonas musculus TaxID=1915356 RepID=A0ABR2K388_9EUKA